MTKQYKLITCFATVLCVVFLSIGYFLQYGLGMEPCPLCILQRIVFMLLIMVYALQAFSILNKPLHYFYGTLSILFNGCGMALSLRQISLQALPLDQMPSCSLGFEQLLAVYPLWEVLKQTLQGSGECGRPEVILGISLPVWTALGFSVLIVISFLLISKVHKFSRR